MILGMTIWTQLHPSGFCSGSFWSSSKAPTKSHENSSPALSVCIAFRMTGPINNNVRPLQLKAAHALVSCLLDVKTLSCLV